MKAGSAQIKDATIKRRTVCLLVCLYCDSFISAWCISFYVVSLGWCWWHRQTNSLLL